VGSAASSEHGGGKVYRLCMPGRNCFAQNDTDNRKGLWKTNKHSGVAGWGFTPKVQRGDFSLGPPTQCKGGRGTGRNALTMQRERIGTIGGIQKQKSDTREKRGHRSESLRKN